MNIVNKMIKRLLKAEETERQVRELQEPVSNSTKVTVRKINKVNRMLEKTTTYYLAKAMGLVK